MSRYMTEAQREHNAELDRDYWSWDGKVISYTRRDVLRYAAHTDAASFFDLLADNAGTGRNLDDLIDCYAEENDDEIQEFVDYE